MSIKELIREITETRQGEEVEIHWDGCLRIFVEDDGSKVAPFRLSVDPDRTGAFMGAEDLRKIGKVLKKLADIQDAREGKVV